MTDSLNLFVKSLYYGKLDKDKLEELPTAVIKRRDMGPQLVATTAGINPERILWLRRKFYDEIEVEIKTVDLLLNHLRIYDDKATSTTALSTPMSFKPVQNRS